MKRRRHAGRTAVLLLPVGLLLGLLFNPSMASAQTRVDRTLSVQPQTPVVINALPAPVTILPLPTPAPTNNTARNKPSGSYVSDAMGAAIQAKNVDYETIFKVSLPVPPGSTISNVSWKYGLSRKPIGFEAVLCWDNQQRCWNLTNNPSGNTQAFNGKNATRPFMLHYRVQGGGPLGPPALGEMNQLIVTYDLPD